MQIETFLLTHAYEEYQEGKFKPSLVRSKEPINTTEVDLLIFYLQTIAYEIEETFALSSNEVAAILEKFYGFETLGQHFISELEDDMRILDTAWMGYVREPHCTRIDLYSNWERFASIYDVINTSQHFFREGLREYICQLIADQKESRY